MPKRVPIDPAKWVKANVLQRERMMKKALGHNELSYEKRGGHPDKMMKLWRERLAAAGFEQKKVNSSHSPDGSHFNNGTHYEDQFGNTVEVYRHLGVTASGNSYRVQITLNIPRTFENHLLKRIERLKHQKKRAKGAFWYPEDQEKLEYYQNLLAKHKPLEKITEEEKVKFFKFYEEKMAVRGGAPMDLLQSRELDGRPEFLPYGELMWLYTEDEEAFNQMREKVSSEV